MLKINHKIISLEKIKRYWQECCQIIPKEKKTKEILKQTFFYAKEKIIEIEILEQIIELSNVEEISFTLIQQEINKLVEEKKIFSIKNIDKQKKYQLQIQIEKDLKIRALFKKWSKNILPPTDEESLKYYEENKEKFREKERFIFKAVLSKDKTKNTKKKIDQLYSLFAQKGDFDFLEKYLNKYEEETIEYKKKLAIEKDILPDTIENLLFNLKKGEVSSIIEINDSFSFFQYIEYLPERIQPYLETKKTINKRLFFQKVEKNKNSKIEEYKKKITIIDNYQFKDLY